MVDFGELVIPRVSVHRVPTLFLDVDCLFNPSTGPVRFFAQNFLVLPSDSVVSRCYVISYRRFVASRGGSFSLGPREVEASFSSSSCSFLRTLLLIYQTNKPFQANFNTGLLYESLTCSYRQMNSIDW